MSTSPRPTLVKPQPVEMVDRVFWLTVREGLLLLVKAIERRHLRNLKKGERLN